MDLPAVQQVQRLKWQIYYHCRDTSNLQRQLNTVRPQESASLQQLGVPFSRIRRRGITAEVDDEISRLNPHWAKTLNIHARATDEPCTLANGRPQLNQLLLIVGILKTTWSVAR